MPNTTSLRQRARDNLRSASDRPQNSEIPKKYHWNQKYWGSKKDFKLVSVRFLGIK